MGLISPTSVNGNRFLILFIDGGSRLAFLFATSSLDKTFDMYMRVRNIYNTQLKKKVKKFVSDGHATYTSKTFEAQFMKDKTVISIQTPYCPQQNSIVERRVRMMIEMGRTLLIQSGMPPTYWEEAALHSNFMRNRVLRVMKKMTPYEKFWRKRPDLRWVHPFGCLTYFLIHKEQ